MPSIHDFQKTKKQPHQQKAEDSNMSKHEQNKHEKHHTHGKGHDETQTDRKNKRRPGREAGHESHEEPATAHEASAHTTHETHSAAHSHETHHHAKHGKKVEISFPGSEVLRAKWSKPFEVAEQVATDWVNDGNFEGLPLGHPVAQVLAAQGLKKAKQVEKKVVASGVIEKVATQALTVGMKAQQEINNIREQVKTKLGRK